jgi:Kef-type K+ transport system membrane component KefB
MSIACAAGLWAIIAFGSSLEAPADLAGEWILSRVDSSIAQTDVPRRMHVRQSGQFLEVAFDGAPPTSFRLTRPIADSPQLELRSPELLLRVAPESTADELRIDLRRMGVRGGAIGLIARRPAPDAPASPGDDARSPRDVRVSAHHLLLLLLAEIAIILAASQVMGLAFTRIGQPKVMGEMVAGIMLGPSLLGYFFPDLAASLFPEGAVRYLGILSQIGVIFFLFLIGLELDPKLIRNRGHAAVVISHMSIIAPLLLGSALAIYLYPRVFNNTPEMRFSSVALFMGAAMSITAFPVLARILTERNLHKTPVGAISITCAAVDDVTAWCMLAFVVAFARAEGHGRAVLTAALSLAYIAIMYFLVRPLLARLQGVFDRQGNLSRPVTALIFLLILASAGTTEAIGIHALFGAFLLGAIMPKENRFVEALREKLEDFTVILLLPIFFAYTGLQTSIDMLSSPELWWLSGLVILIACAGKFGGSAIAARACRLNWREASAIGILMNTRGLMQLVILGVGRELGVITDAVFAMMVLMALVTTFLTSPVLEWVYPDRLLRKRREGEAAVEGGYTIVLPVSLPRSGPPLVRLADVISGPGDTRRLVALHLREAVEQDAYRAAVNDPAADRSETLDVVEKLARAEGLPIEPVSFVSRDPAVDIARVAHERAAKLILMGFHNPVFGHALLGGTVHRVMQLATTDVAVFVDRGLPTRPRSILVPYMGSPHDRLALELAARMARYGNAAVTVLHVVTPGRARRDAAKTESGAQQLTERVFNDPSQPQPVTFDIMESDDRVSVVLARAKAFDVVVVGVAEEWGLKSHLFGWRPERIARDCPSSLLIVRKYLGGAGA